TTTGVTGTGTGSAGNDTNPVNNTTTFAVASQSLADVSVSLALTGTATPGGTVTGTVTFYNLGSTTAVNVTRTVSLTGGTITAATGASVDPTGKTATFPVISIIPGATASFTFTYVVPAAGSVNATASIATTTTETNVLNNVATASTTVGSVSAAVSGRACIDANRSRSCDPGEPPLPNVLVRLYSGNSTATLVTTALTQANGSYSISGVAPGTYTLAFFDCANPLLPASCTNIGTTPVNQAAFTASGLNPSTGVTGGVVAKSGGLGTVGMSITNIRVYPGDNTFDQNLPLDPNGIVYSSGPGRNPVAGAVVRLIGPGGSDPSALLLGNSNTVVTGINGFYQFFFVNATAADNGTYTLTVQAPPSYSPPVVTSATFAIGGGVAAPGSLSPVPPGATNAQPQATPPLLGGNTTYYLNFRYNFTPGLAGEVFNNHIPLDPLGGPVGGPVGTVADVSVVKTGPATLAGGFTGTYTITITNAGPGAATNVRVEDILPSGLTLVSASITPAASWNLGTGTTGAVAESASLAVGSSTLTLVVQASAAAVGTTITNVATITTTSTDTNAANNVSRASTLIVGADVSIIKTGPATVATGTTISYVLT
ncbi:MAG: DUF11 domain-containing protein, partial [Burkholderiales bacterium]